MKNFTSFFLSFFFLLSLSFGQESKLSIEKPIITFDYSDAPSGVFLGQYVPLIPYEKHQGERKEEYLKTKMGAFQNIWSLIDQQNGKNSFPERMRKPSEVSEIGLIIQSIDLLDQENAMNGSIKFEHGIFNRIDQSTGLYTTQKLVVASATNTKFSISDPKFKLSKDLFLSDLGLPNAILIDWKDGKGFRKTEFEKVIDVPYDEPGLYKPEIKLVFDDNTFYTGLSITSKKGSSYLNRMSPNFDQQETISVDFGGHQQSALVTSFFACDNKLTRPIIILDGIETKPWTNSIDYNVLLSAFQLDAHCLGAQSGSNTPVYELLQEQGYDLLFVDWDNSHTSVEALAALLREIINVSNESKKLNGSNAKINVIGFSLGGVVGKYALRSMEIAESIGTGPGHDTDIFLSFDSPFQGANVPVALQGLIKFLTDPILIQGIPVPTSISSQFLGEMSVGNECNGSNSMEELDVFREFLESKVAQQLLIYSPFSGAAQIRNDFKTSLLEMGNLQSARHIAIANGSLFADPIFPPGSVMICINKKFGAIPWFYSEIDVELRSRPLGNVNPVSLIHGFIGVLILGQPLSIPQFNRHQVINGDGIDSAPGGLTSNGKDLFAGSGGFNGQVLQDLYCFIPTRSALNYPVPFTWYTDLSDKESIIPYTGLFDYVGAEGQTLFDDQFFYDANCLQNQDQLLNQRHVSPSYRNMSFVLHHFLEENELASLAGDPKALLGQGFNFAYSKEKFDLSNCTSNRVGHEIDFDLLVNNFGRFLINKNSEVGFDGSGIEASNHSEYSVVLGSNCDDENYTLTIGNTGIASLGTSDGKNGHLIIESGNTLHVKNRFNMLNASTLTIEEGAHLIIESTDHFSLSGADTKVILKGDLTTIGNVSILCKGHIEIHESASTTFGGEFAIRGIEKEDLMVDLLGESQFQFFSKNVKFENGKILYHTNSNAISFTAIDKVEMQNISIIRGDDYSGSTDLSPSALAFRIVKNVHLNNVDMIDLENTRFIVASAFPGTSSIFNYQSGTLQNAKNGMLLNSYFDVNLNELNIDGVEGIEFGIGVEVANTDEMVIDGVTISYFGENNNISFENAAGIKATHVKQIDAIRSRFSFNSRGIYVPSIQNGNRTNISLKGCQINSNYHGVEMQSSSNDRTLKISCSGITNNRYGVIGRDINLVADALEPQDGIFPNYFTRYNDANAWGPFRIFKIAYYNYFTPDILLRNNRWTGSGEPENYDFQIADYSGIQVVFSTIHVDPVVTWPHEVNNCFREVIEIGPRTIEITESAKLYPNPVEDALNIEKKGSYGLLIFNAQGIEVSKSRMVDKFRWNVSNLRSGVYYIQLIDRTTNQKEIKRFVKI